MCIRDSIWTDHRPLVGIFDKALAALENARLMRMREKIIPYTFKITWVAGKTDYIADALSRYPVFGSAEDNFNVDTAIKCLRSLTAEPDSLKSIYNKQNEAYKLVMTELRNNADFSKLPNDHPARAYKNIQNRLSIDRDEQGNEVMLKDSQKIVVPKGAQDEILKELHRSHSGILKTYTTATQLYYWPGMKNSIKQMIESCGSCQRDRPSKQRTTVHISPPSKAQSPMKHVAADLFDAAGEKWIVLVDRYSGYAWTDKLKDTSTATVTAKLNSWFVEYGYPEYIRTDGGPQFRRDFKAYCDKHYITHELSSPYNPESNGLAEAAVKNMKSLILPSADRKEQLSIAIAA